MAAAPIITAVSLFRLDIPLREPFVISLGPIERVQNVAVHIQTSAGLGGWGECSPFATINGETAETCLAVGRLFARALHGKNALDIAGNVALMDRLIWANSSIKSAFDMALHDIAAQHAGQPLYQFLGGQNDKPLHTDMTVSLGPGEKMAADALRFQQEGFTVIKVKLGGHPDEDIARMGAIRKAIGPHLPLRIDANQGWPDAPTALKVLQALAPFGIQHCEEPIPRWLFTELPQLSAASPIPIMADESMCSPHDAQRLIALNACPLFNVKLGKSGGLHHAANIAGQAASAGIGLQVGGFMESRLGMTAAAHLALASPAVHFCDFDTPLMFTEDPVEGGFQFGPNGLIQMPQTPGLGAAFSPRFLEAVFSI
ncbi:mandelate racemase/muconate lactonizing enzyme family protein [Pseudocnuella soli]|uniref:mandelate racemase/muconate lactonizing enzyme family protein n=1 Tax=Pseudocnuella soli TaxID=2502779 RepID=UPI001042C42E|nr:dipeptide epimerase [Pseudocnuella soli]